MGRVAVCAVWSGILEECVSPRNELVDAEAQADLIDALGEDEVRKLWIKLLDGVPDWLDRLDAAIAKGDAAAVATTAHALKGAALNLGFTALGEAGRALEQAARAGSRPLLPLLGHIRETERRTREWVG